MARQFLTAIDLAKNELQNARVQNLASAPAAPVKGQLYMNTSDNILYWWDGTAWVAAKDAGGSGFPGYGAGGSTVAETTFGLSKADGVATTVARADHTHGSPTHDAAAHSTIPINSLAGATGPIDMNGFKLTEVGIPSADTDAANKGYVDSAIAGLAWKDSARVATTANITLSGFSAIDGVTVVNNDRVLVKNQTTPAQNGLYAAASGAWARVADADQEAEMKGMAVYVEEGTTQADTAWVLTTNSPFTPGTTALTYAQFGGGQLITAGGGLVQTGNVFDVVAGDSSITVAADSVIVATAGVTNAKLANMPGFTFKGNNTSPSAPPIDMTLSQAATILVNPLSASFLKKFAVDCAAALTTVVTHNFDSREVVVEVYRSTTPWDTIECDVERTSVNTITVRFDVAPTAAQYRIVVIGLDQ